MGAWCGGEGRACLVEAALTSRCEAVVVRPDSWALCGGGWLGHAMELINGQEVLNVRVGCVGLGWVEGVGG